MDIKYDFIPDELDNDSHAHQLRQVPPGSRVLEFGCATGYVARYLKERRGCRVTGVDVVEAYARRAAEHCERVVVGDLDRLDFAAEFGAERYDVALFGDVLEHLVAPARVLTATRELLAPGGRVVATVPNVAHGDLRLALMAGRFEYRRLGLLDETHLRFFTHASLVELFERSGYVITSFDRITCPLFGTELGVRAEMFPPEAVRWIAQDPESTTYQFVVVAVPAGVGVAATPDAQDAAEAARKAFDTALDERDAARRERDALQARLDDVTDRTASLEATARRVPDLEAHVAALSEQLAHHQAREAEVLPQLQDLQARHQALLAQFTDVEARFLAMRRASFLNPFVVLPALLRRLRTPPKGSR